MFTSCECTESRVSSSHHHHRRPPRRRSRSRLAQRQFSAPSRTATTTSYRSSSESDDEDLSTINADDLRREHLPQPDLIQSTMNDEYCQHLQQMADLSNQQRFNEQSIPFFGKDDHVTPNDPSQMPTTSLEKTLLFN